MRALTLKNHKGHQGHQAIKLLGSGFFVVFVIFVVPALPFVGAVPRAAGCDPVGEIRFVCDQAGPEDLVAVPGTVWLIASAYGAEGGLNLIDTKAASSTRLFPSATAKERPDTKTYDSCPGPLQGTDREKFRTHGLYLKPGRNVHTLYVVHHGNRESVEVFELDARPKQPSVTWIGCAVAPDPIGLNAVVALPEGGFAASNFDPRPPAGARGGFTPALLEGTDQRRAVGMAYRTRMVEGAGQRSGRRQRARDLEGRQVVLRGRVGQSIVHAPVARADAGQARRDLARVPGGQRAVGARRLALRRGAGRRRRRSRPRCRRKSAGHHISRRKSGSEDDEVSGDHQLPDERGGQLRHRRRAGGQRTVGWFVARRQNRALSGEGLRAPQ